MSTPPVRGPLEQHLAPPLDDARIAALAQGLRSRAPARRRPFAVGFALAAVAALLAVGVLMLLPRPPEPLAWVDGRGLEGPLSGRVALSDGSFVTVDEGAQVGVAANQPEQLTLQLKAGRTRFEVKPGGRRRWLIEAGIASVEVVGTVFTVERTPAGVHVSVERGTVLVRGESLPDRLVRLEAGQSTFAAQKVPSPLVGEGPGEGAEEPPSVERAPAPAPEPPRRPQADWQGPAGRGDFEGAWSALREPGFKSRLAVSKSADELQLLADVARATGHWPQAAAALTRLLALSPEDPTAAFSLGRLELEHLGQPKQAAGHFAQVQGPLARDARVRQVEALAAAGDLDSAVAAANAALASGPDGRLQRWLDDPQHAAAWLH